MKVFFTLLLTFFAYYVTAQEVLVIDQTTNEPIIGVVAYNKSKSKSVMSDLDGKINLSGFETDETIVFQHLSYLKHITLMKLLFRHQSLNKANVIFLKK